MKFITTYIMILILCYILVFFGGWIAFNFYGVLAVCALIITVVVSVFCEQEERMERLEKRIEVLEGKKEATIGEEGGLR